MATNQLARALSTENQSMSPYNPQSPYYNPWAVGNRPIDIPASQPQQGGVIGPMPPPTLWGAPNPAYHDWLRQQSQPNTAAGLQTQQINYLKEAEEARWSRVMALLEAMGLGNLVQGGGTLGGGKFAEQATARYAQPAIRNYENRRREIANTMGARGMSLGTATDYAGGQAYGDLARALAEAGTAGELGEQGLAYGLLGDLLSYGRS